MFRKNLLWLMLFSFLLTGCALLRKTGQERSKGLSDRETCSNNRSTERKDTAVEIAAPLPPISDAPIEPACAPEIPRTAQRPEIRFAENESAHVRIPFSLNNPFKDSDELTVCPADLEAEFCYPYPGKLISPYGPRGRSYHTGIDIKALPNDTIRAAMPGVVRMSKPYSSYGNIVVIRHYNGIETVYAHNSKNLVSVNDAVEAGTPIGLAGRTGRATTEHLHFELRVGSQHFNPQLLVDPDKRCLRSDTLYFYNRNGKVTAYKQRRDKNREPEAEGKPLEPLPASTSGSSAPADKKVYYTVKKGDTLSRIARIHGTTVSKICALNGIKPTKILQIKERLRVK